LNISDIPAPGFARGTVDPTPTPSAVPIATALTGLK